MSFRCRLGIHDRQDLRPAPDEYLPDGRRKLKKFEVWCSRCGKQLTGKESA